MNILKPLHNKNYAALLGFTSTDLYPRPSWDIVFGIAYMKESIGLWSVARFGRGDDSEAFRKQFLERSMSTASHETAHLFGMAHCIAWDCLMNGSDSLEESDRHPLVFCPSCQAKVNWLSRRNTVESLLKQREVLALGDLKKTITVLDQRLACCGNP